MDMLIIMAMIVQYRSGVKPSCSPWSLLLGDCASCQSRCGFENSADATFGIRQGASRGPPSRLLVTGLRNRTRFQGLSGSDHSKCGALRYVESIV